MQAMLHSPDGIIQFLAPDELRFLVAALNAARDAAKAKHDQKHAFYLANMQRKFEIVLREINT